MFGYMPFRLSYALRGFSLGLPSTLIDRLSAFGSFGSSNCSSSIRALEKAVLLAITDNYLRLCFVSDILPSSNYPTQESGSRFRSNGFNSTYHLNPSALYAQETSYGMGNLEQRGTLMGII